MKKVMAIILCMILALPLFGCELKREKSWREKVDSIEVGMTVVELFDLMGEPDADIGRGANLLMYILPNQHVTVVCVDIDYTQENRPLAVMEKPVVLSYEDFKEHYRHYPDDPSVWWNNVTDIQPAPTIVPVTDVYEGLSMETFLERYCYGDNYKDYENQYLGINNYYFIFDENNNPTILTSSKNGTADGYIISSITAYDKNAINICEETFYCIEQGMSIHEVVGLVGNPDWQTSDGITLVWYCNDQFNFHISWKTDSSDPSLLIVNRVYIRDLNANTYERIV